MSRPEQLLEVSADLDRDGDRLGTTGAPVLAVVAVERRSEAAVAAALATILPVARELIFLGIEGFAVHVEVHRPGGSPTAGRRQASVCPTMACSTPPVEIWSRGRATAAPLLGGIKYRPTPRHEAGEPTAPRAARSAPILDPAIPRNRSGPREHLAPQL